MTLLFAFPEQENLAEKLRKSGGFQEGQWEWRYFPDGESYVRILSDVKAKSVTVLCSLNNPDTKTLPLIYLARTLKELGAGKITLIAPYLGYMRQDKRFKDGEAITSNIFSRLLSPYIDALVTIDPHLHRHAKLEEIYSCACKVLSAAPLMAEWIGKNISNPLLVGPDKESEQWVASVAAQVNAPYVILEKTRHGDRDVSITLPDIRNFKQNTPVLLDDIISSGVTMLRAIDLLRGQEHEDIVCLATHGLFADNAYDALLQKNVKIVTADTVPHPSNALDAAALLIN